MKDKIALDAVRRSTRVRVPVARPVKIGLKEGTLVDVSSAGAFVTHAGPLKVGAEVTMTFDLDGRRFNGKLKVQSCGVVGRASASGETLYASRLYFTNLPDESQQLIDEILATE
jgi:PilZ domain